MMALYVLITLRCGNCKAAFIVCCVFLPLVYLPLNLRPQMLAYLFLVLTLIILERFRQGHAAALWLLPPLFLVWVNTHGTFTLGVFALAVYWASGLVEIPWQGLESRRWTKQERVQLEGVGLLSLVALIITPYGTQLLLYPLDLALHQGVMVANIAEWQPIAFNMIVGEYFMAVLVAFWVAQIALQPRWRLDEAVLLLTGIVGVCLHVRLMLAFVPFCAPLFGVILARWVPRYDPAKDKRVLNAAFIVFLLAAVVHYFPSRSRLQNQLQEKWPVRAVEYLRQHPAPAHLFNSYGYGGFLIWQMADQSKVFIDGRADIYLRSGVLVDYLDIGRLEPAAPYLLNTYDIQACLLDRHEHLIILLNALPEWQRVYSDPLTVLYVRKPRASGKNPGAGDP